MQIKLLTLDSDEWTFEQQLRKISEEHHEVIVEGGFAIGHYHHERLLGRELLDLMQACKTALEILQRESGTDNWISNRISEHETKLRLRADEGKIKLVEENDG